MVKSANAAPCTMIGLTAFKTSAAGDLRKWGTPLIIAASCWREGDHGAHVPPDRRHPARALVTERTRSRPVSEQADHRHRAVCGRWTDGRRRAPGQLPSVPHAAPDAPHRG